MFGNERVYFVGNVRLQLHLKLVDFVPQVCNDILVCADVLIDKLFVWLYAHFYVLRAVSVLKCVDCLLVLLTSRRDSCDHNCLAIAAQRILKHSSQLTVTEGNEKSFLVLVTQCVDTVSQCEKACVNFRTLAQSDTSVLSNRTSLTTSQVN